MSGIGVSGCFGSQIEYEQLDTAADAAAVVDELEQLGQSVPEAIDPTACTVVQLGVAYESMARRLRLLTWAVLLLTLYVVAKELKI